jgi:hypothetical protein
MGLPEVDTCPLNCKHIQILNVIREFTLVTFQLDDILFLNNGYFSKRAKMMKKEIKNSAVWVTCVWEDSYHQATFIVNG